MEDALFIVISIAFFASCWLLIAFFDGLSRNGES